MNYNIRQLLAFQHAGGVLETPALDVNGLSLLIDQQDVDAVELMKLSKELVLAKRAFEEAVQRFSIKHNINPTTEEPLEDYHG